MHQAMAMGAEGKGRKKMGAEGKGRKKTLVMDK